VPVGQDQVVHVELTREVARRFNNIYPGADAARAVLPEPQVLLTPSPKLPGTDGRKMSKSYGNTILLTDPETEIRKKLKTMVTDPARIRRSDPGNPDLCPVFDLHRIFSSPETQQKAAEGCRTAGIGCIECKGWLADGVVAELAPLQERRRQYESKPQQVWEILDAGSARARTRAEETMRQVRDAMQMVQINPVRMTGAAK
jgi:tryptophanyl-tRNA synthetase